MGADIDMQGHRIYNLPDAVSNGEPVTYAQWVEGLVTREFTGYLKEVITATASQTVFNLSNEYTPGLGALAVYVNGIRLTASDYTETDEDTVTFSSPLFEDDEVEFIITSFEVTP
jgi:glycyl-tRNA synthetase alpha subunit